MFKIRRFEDNDADKVSNLIKTTLRVSNIIDYSKEFIEKLVDTNQSSDILKKAGWTHFYVAYSLVDEEIIGCGAIGPFWGSLVESSLFSIFVLPRFQKFGVGRKIIEVLERDEFFTRATRIEVPAIKTAVGFYQKMGYDYKNGNSYADEEGFVRMEKFRDKVSR